MRRSEFIQQAVLNMLTNLSGETPYVLTQKAEEMAREVEKSAPFEKERLTFG